MINQYTDHQLSLWAWSLCDETWDQIVTLSVAQRLCLVKTHAYKCTYPPGELELQNLINNIDNHFADELIEKEFLD